MNIPASLKRKIDECTSLVSLPAIAIEVLQMADDPGTGLADIEKVISNDPALSAKIIRVANSPLFARSKNIESILQALTLLGLDSAISLALSFSLMGSLRNAAGDEFNTDRLWRRTIVAAIVSRELGLKIRISNHAALFLSGLLQDIGMLALSQIDPTRYPQLLESNSHSQLIEKELDAYACDHAAVGTCLAKAWRLPPILVDALAGSHNTEIKNDLDETGRFNLCIALSGVISDWVLDDQQNQIDFIRNASSKLGLDDKDINQLIDNVLQLLPNMSQLFELELIDESSIEGILEKSSHMLQQRQQSRGNSRKPSQEAEFLERRARSLEEMARRDALTGLYNAHYMSSAVSEEFNKAIKQGHDLAVLILEVDSYEQFKADNGEQIAEFMLKKLADIIETQAAKQTITGRYGNARFILLSPGRATQEAKTHAEALLTTITASPLELADSFVFPVSCSAGLACLNATHKFAAHGTFLKAAEAALNKAKQTGQGQLQSYNEA